ncbi:MAG: DUF1833 family protein [Pseudomonadota bacterium]
MNRNVPANVRTALEQPETGIALLAFLTIRHSELDVPIRVVSDPLNYVWGGETYTGILFDFRPLTDTDAQPTTELRVPNVDRRIGQAVLDANDRPQVQMSILSSADFDLTVNPRTEIGTATPIYAYSHFELREVSVDPVELRGTVTLRDYSVEPWPGLSATESRLPGLFR